MISTMQDRPLTITGILRHGERVHADSRVVTFTGEDSRRSSYGEIGRRAGRLASALVRLGVKAGDRVGTFCWNSQEHLEAYFAIPCIGAVLHTLNIRLFPEQLAYIINHAEDKVILVDDTLVPILARVAGELTTVKTFVVIGPADATALPGALGYDELLAAEEDGFDWPELDERSAAAMCYTSGTTGNPKGVVYSHRSTFLHSMATGFASTFGLTDRDRVLLIVPMFHANAWGLPYGSVMAGADLILPGRFLQSAPLCNLIAAERVTFAGAVPTIWNDILHYAESNPVDLSSLRRVLSGGSAVPRSLIEKLSDRHGITLIQAWGMTETSPLAAVSHPPKDCPSCEEMDWRAKSGRLCPGVELRLMDGDKELPWDGQSVGEIQVRGPWITGAYYGEDTTEKFQDGWLCTGDVGSVDAKGFIQITDRAKDVIKSGGEWISSVELETKIMSHPEVMEAAVIGVADERWDERPLACVMLKPGSAATPAELREHLTDLVARWWIPERWAFVDEVPKTSVGKFDKKVLRLNLKNGSLTVISVDRN
jgi:fatty-acyl-CoA synthase